jgi:hypothetical protein
MKAGLLRAVIDMRIRYRSLKFSNPLARLPQFIPFFQCLYPHVPRQQTLRAVPTTPPRHRKGPPPIPYARHTAFNELCPGRLPPGACTPHYTSLLSLAFLFPFCQEATTYFRTGPNSTLNIRYSTFSDSMFQVPWFGADGSVGHGPEAPCHGVINSTISAQPRGFSQSFSASRDKSGICIRLLFLVIYACSGGHRSVASWI